MKKIIVGVLIGLSAGLVMAGVIIPSTPPTRPVLALSDVVLKIKQQNTELYASMKMRHALIFNMIWPNPNYTPQQIMEGFGTDAAMLFSMSGMIQDMLHAVDPSYEALSVPEGYTVTINQDGTVNITQGE